jgi:hypothetical protein
MSYSDNSSPVVVVVDGVVVVLVSGDIVSRRVKPRVATHLSTVAGTV